MSGASVLRISPARLIHRTPAGEFSEAYPPNLSRGISRRGGAALRGALRRPAGGARVPAHRSDSREADRAAAADSRLALGRAGGAAARRRGCRSRSCRRRSTRRRSRPAMLAEGGAAARHRRCAGRAQGAAGGARGRRSGWCSAPTRCWSATAACFDKPRDLAEARDAARARCAASATSSCPPPWSSRTGARSGGTSGAPQLAMRPFSDAFLDAYLAEQGEALLATVGAYRLEDGGAQLFAGSRATTSPSSACRSSSCSAFCGRAGSVVE